VQLQVLVDSAIATRPQICPCTGSQQAAAHPFVCVTLGTPNKPLPVVQ
jgi:hypothetical protein